jgi:hypothetical protein
LLGVRRRLGVGRGQRGAAAPLGIPAFIFVAFFGCLRPRASGLLFGALEVAVDEIHDCGVLVGKSSTEGRR